MCYSQSFEVKVTNVQQGRGKVVVELYQDESSWLKRPLKISTLPTTTNQVIASFSVPAGKYGIAVYQDIDDNEILDRNFIGIPKELVGFGNNYKPFGNPKYEPAVVEYNSSSRVHEIKLFEVF